MLPTFLFFLRISSAICGLLWSQMNFRTIAPTAEGGQDHLPSQWPPLPTWNSSPAVGWGGVGAAWLGGSWRCFPGPPASLYPCKSSSHLSLLCSLKEPRQNKAPAVPWSWECRLSFCSIPSRGGWPLGCKHRCLYQNSCTEASPPVTQAFSPTWLLDAFVFPCLKDSSLFDLIEFDAWINDLQAKGIRLGHLSSIIMTTDWVLSVCITVPKK